MREDLSLPPAVVEITAEAGVAPDARRAEFTAEMRAFHLGVHNRQEMSRPGQAGRLDPLGLAV